MLTRQDFEYIAKLIRDNAHNPQKLGVWEARERLAVELADWIEERKPINDRFDRVRFMAAAGCPTRPPHAPGVRQTPADLASDCAATISKAKALLKRWREAS